MLDRASWHVWRISTATGGQYFIGIGVYAKPDANEKVKKAHDALIKALVLFDPDPNPNIRPTVGAFTVQGLLPPLGQAAVPAPLEVFIGTKP